MHLVLLRHLEGLHLRLLLRLEGRHRLRLLLLQGGLLHAQRLLLRLLLLLHVRLLRLLRQPLRHRHRWLGCHPCFLSSGVSCACRGRGDRVRTR